ncbi:hypothetical protein JXA84_07140 [candidate division WOR-3 bacterium]|nr:hypothetical protein [candidate division WOR-3 bacterium]
MLSGKELKQKISFNSETPKPKMTAKKILEFFSLHYGLDKYDIIKDKGNDVTLKVIYAIWSLTGLNAKEAGGIFELKPYVFSLRLSRFRKRLRDEKSTREDVIKLLEPINSRGRT